MDRVNIIYELGLMHALSKRVAVLFNSKNEKQKPPSDILGLIRLEYNQKISKIASLQKVLIEWILGNVDEVNRATLEKEKTRINAILAHSK